MNTPILIRFTSDTIQETMNHTKMNETHTTEAERMLDTNKKSFELNQSHRKKFLPLKRKISAYMETFDIQESYETKRQGVLGALTSFLAITNII